MKRSQILVGIIMGSDTLTNLAICHEKKVVSAHRTPDLLFEYAENANERGIEVIIAGAGGAAHLPGMTAAKTHIPVIGVPIKTKSLEGKDSLLSILQMPAGIPVATVAIGKAGSINAGLLAASILSNKYPNINKKVLEFRKKQTRRVLKASKLL
jgi:5-(carboxyamino)imidazole ribonucleotide mutase